LISEEIAVDQAELSDNVQFADFGVNSLMLLTIFSALREALGLDVPRGSL
jgi:naphtho-gamma-pyrone polyketide synthase